MVGLRTDTASPGNRPNRDANLIGDREVTKAGRVINAMLQMKKLDIAKLKQAHGS